jgi:hypothetical protein
LFLQRREAWLRRISLDEIVGLATLLVLLSSPFTTNRSLVLKTVEMQAFLATLGAGIFARVIKMRT